MRESQGKPIPLQQLGTLNMVGLVDTKTAAAAVGLSYSHLYRNAHWIPAAYRAGRAVRWDLNELKCWMREQAHATKTTTSAEIEHLNLAGNST